MSWRERRRRRREQNRISKEIDLQLKRDWQKAKMELKLLLLGGRESGKSTLIKQMQVLQRKSYSENDRLKFKVTVYRNVYTAIQTVLVAMKLLQIPFESPEVGEEVEQLAAVRPYDVQELVPAHAQLIAQLWKDGGVQSCYQHCRQENKLSDSAKYLLDNLDRICDEDYVPTTDDIDIVQVSTTTTSIGIVEHHFNIKNVVYRVIDVGDMHVRMDRRKWIPHFCDDVTAVIFMVDVAEYDHYLETGENCLLERLALFETIIGYPWFQNCAIILLLNKKDLFAEKIKTSHLAEHFPDYTGPKFDCTQAQQFIARMFLEVNRNNGQLHIYHKFICALDTESASFIVDMARDHVIWQYSNLVSESSLCASICSLCLFCACCPCILCCAVCVHACAD